MKQKKSERNSNWKIPKNATNYFSPKQEKMLKQKYGVWYNLHTMFSIVILLIPVIIFFTMMPDNVLNAQTQGGNTLGAIAGIIGVIGALSIGVGIVNIFMALIKQYLGHYMTLISIVAGIVVDAVAMLLFRMVK